MLCSYFSRKLFVLIKNVVSLRCKRKGFAIQRRLVISIPSTLLLVSLLLFNRTFRALGQEGTLLVILDICYKEVACYLERLPFLFFFLKVIHISNKWFHRYFLDTALSSLLCVWLNCTRLLIVAPLEFSHDKLSI